MLSSQLVRRFPTHDNEGGVKATPLPHYDVCFQAGAQSQGENPLKLFSDTPRTRA